ncbi:hypothetical protein FY034_18915 (plasmid) [Trichlorobacter lovleyi]|uniref:hypothetical protein n=1 Tax=Trichlorobacter lovleyi TaxID=313985 RepID=UPI00223F27A5|nr:hypothetical protein [Trichlorobacter lovleyi]QOX81049.1 hypothetical protein FY034_18915 [Trichlorobacter lovleyi]
MKPFFAYTLLFLASLFACHTPSEASEASATTLYCNIDSKGGVFHYDTRGALYEGFGKNFGTNCFTHALEEVKFNCASYPADFVVRESKIAEVTVGFLRDNQKFDPKTIVFCQINSEMADLWKRTYNNELPTTLRKLEDGSYSSSTRHGQVFIFVHQTGGLK